VSGSFLGAGTRRVQAFTSPYCGLSFITHFSNSWWQPNTRSVSCCILPPLSHHTLNFSQEWLNFNAICPICDRSRVTYLSHRTAKFLTPEWPMKNGDCWNFYGFLPSAGHALMVSMGAILRKLAIENHLAVLVPFFLFLCQSLCEQLSTSSHWSSSGQYQMLGNHCAWLGADGSCETCEVCLDRCL
jgi:hypothetical protein